MERIGVVLATNDAYAMQTTVLLCSILENNANAANERKVDIIVYLYADNWTEQSINVILELGKRYDCRIDIKNPKPLYEHLQKIMGEPWAGKHNNLDSSTYAPDIRVVVADEIQEDYNLLCLDSDMIMVSGTDLYELATWKFGKGCCASVIDFQNNAKIKKSIGLKEENIIFNNGIFLVNPKLYREYNVSEIIEHDFKKVSDIFSIYYNVTRNAYAFRNLIETLPLKYMIFPPMKDMIKKNDWLWIFDIDRRNYYSDSEIEEAVQQPVFVHYINWIVRKPWNRYPYIKEAIPYHDEWDKYQNLTPYKVDEKPAHLASKSEILRYKLFKYFYGLYVFICGMAYRNNLKKRNKIVRKKAEEKNITL